MRRLNKHWLEMTRRFVSASSDVAQATRLMKATINPLTHIKSSASAAKTMMSVFMPLAVADGVCLLITLEINKATATMPRNTIQIMMVRTMVRNQIHQLNMVADTICSFCISLFSMY